jgi:hypothetical protein
MVKYQRFTKRRRQRGGFSFSSLAPAGFPTSLSDLKNLVTETVERVPALKTVSGAVGKISDVSTTLSTVSSTITDLPNKVKENVQGVVDAQLAKAGIPPIGTSATSGPTDGNDPGASNTENNTEPNDPVNEDPNVTASGGGRGGAYRKGTDRIGDSAEYELVTLSRPVSDPLFVCFKSGKAVYFTRGAKGVTILSNGNVSHTRRKKHRRT